MRECDYSKENGICPPPTCCDTCYERWQHDSLSPGLTKAFEKAVKKAIAENEVAAAEQARKKAL